MNRVQYPLLACLATAFAVLCITGAGSAQTVVANPECLTGNPAECDFVVPDPAMMTDVLQEPPEVEGDWLLEGIDYEDTGTYGHNLSINGTHVADFDVGRLLPRDFNITARLLNDTTGPNGKWMELTITPDSPDETESLVVFSGQALVQLLGDPGAAGFDAVTHESHQEGFETRYDRDVDGDGVHDLEVTIPHFSSAWVSVGQAGGPLTAVWGTSANNVWAAGTFELWHYDGSSWTDVRPSIMAGQAGALTGISGTSASNVFTAGWAAKVFRYDGSSWTTYDNPWGLSDPYKVRLRDVEAAGDKIWFVGADATNGLGDEREPWAGYYSLSSGAWVQTSSRPRDKGVIQDSWYDGSRLWVSGTHAEPGWQVPAGFAGYYQNGYWVSQNTTWFGEYYRKMGSTFTVTGLETGKPFLFSYAGTLNSRQSFYWEYEGQYPGTYYTLAAQLFQDDLGWLAGIKHSASTYNYITQVNPASVYDSKAYLLPTSADVRGIWGTDKHNIWAVTNNGLILHYTGMPPKEPTIVYPPHEGEMDTTQDTWFTFDVPDGDPDRDGGVSWEVDFLESGGWVTRCTGTTTGPDQTCMVPAGTYSSSSDEPLYWLVRSSDSHGDTAETDVHIVHLYESPETTVTSTTGTYEEPAIVSGALTVTGTTSDPDGWVTDVEYQIRSLDPLSQNYLQYWNGAGWQSGSIFLAASGTSSWSFTWDSRETYAGLHGIAVRATDDEGYSSVFQFWVDVQNMYPGGLWVEAWSDGFGEGDQDYLQPGSPPRSAVPLVNLDWSEESPPALGSGGLYALRLSGAFNVTDGNSYRLTTSVGNVDTKVWVDGVLRFDGPDFSGQEEALVSGSYSSGSHRIVIEFSHTGDFQPLSLWWTGYSGSSVVEPRKLIPPSALYYGSKIGYRGLDTDGDGIPDDWEDRNGMNPTWRNDARLDWDEDRLNNTEEFLYRNFGHMGEAQRGGQPPGGPRQQDLIIEVHHMADGSNAANPTPEALEHVRHYLGSQRKDEEHPSMPQHRLPTNPINGEGGIQTHLIVDRNPTTTATGVWKRDGTTTPPSGNWDFQEDYHSTADDSVFALYAREFDVRNATGEDIGSTSVGFAHPTFGMVFHEKLLESFAESPTNAPSFCEPLFPPPFDSGAEVCYPYSIDPSFGERMVFAHELGHTMDVGEEDDRPNKPETYSGDEGSNPDLTPPKERDIDLEFIGMSSQHTVEDTKFWSVMARGSAVNMRRDSEFQHTGNDDVNSPDGVEWVHDSALDYAYTLTKKHSTASFSSSELHATVIEQGPVLADPPSGPLVNLSHSVSKVFNLVPVDPEGHDVRVVVDWGDGNITASPEYTPSGVAIPMTHAWAEPGSYTIRAAAMDEALRFGEEGPSLTVSVLANGKPAIPDQPLGPLDLPDVWTATYETMTRDVEGQDVTYVFDWDDGTTTSVGPAPSGQVVNATHTWTAAGNYMVTVTPYDSWGLAGDASRELCIRVGQPVSDDACNGLTGGATDAGDTFDTAMAIETGRTYVGYLTPTLGDNFDYYSFPANSGRTVRLMARIPAPHVATMHLYAPDGSLIASTAGTGTLVLEKETIGPEYQEYDQLQNAGASTGYRLAVYGCESCSYAFRASVGPLVDVGRPVGWTRYVDDEVAPVVIHYGNTGTPVELHAEALDGCVEAWAKIHNTDPVDLNLSVSLIGGLPLSNETELEEQCPPGDPSFIEGNLTVRGWHVSSPTDLDWAEFWVDANRTSVQSPDNRSWYWTMPPIGYHDLSYLVRDANGDRWIGMKGNNFVLPECDLAKLENVYAAFVRLCGDESCGSDGCLIDEDTVPEPDPVPECTDPGCLPPVACSNPVTNLTAPETKRNITGGWPDFGYAVAVDGGTVAVGDPGAAAVHVYTCVSGSWQVEATLKVLDPFGFPKPIGQAVAVSGSTLVTSDEVEVQVFERNVTTWSHQATIPLNGLTDVCDYMGWSYVDLALDGNILAVTRNVADSVDSCYSSSAAAFVRHGSMWYFHGSLLSGDDSSWLDLSVDIDGDDVVVGAPWVDGGASNSGSLYVFERSGSAWDLTAQLNASDAQEYSALGFSVAIDGDSILAGAPEHNDGRGLAYVWTRTGGAWSFEASLNATNLTIWSDQGRSVSLAGDVALVGSPMHDERGAATVFVRDGSVWSEAAQHDVAGSMWPEYGSAVAVHGSTAVVGSPIQDDEGAVYIYALAI